MASIPAASADASLKVCPTCGRIIPKKLRVCPVCREPDPYWAMDERERKIWERDRQLYSQYPDTDGRGRRGRWEQDLQHCPQCGKRYTGDETVDAYCRYCGTKRDNTPGRYFVASPDYMECVYGPMPATLYYHCENCGNTWTGSNWDIQYFCPKCGKTVSGMEENRGKRR